MPYTLAKGLVWVLLAVLLGIVIGWLLRSVAARRQIDRVRSGRSDSVELDRLRARNANLEHVVEERDRLRAELAAAPSGRGGAAVDVVSDAPASPDAQPMAGSGSGSGSVEAVPDELKVRSLADAMVTVAPDDSPTLDLVAGAAAIGHPIELDDLTLVEGIGPKISELCHGIGITTWAELSSTEVSLLRTMLNDAGPRFKTHDPTTWPRQAGMLAGGEWEAFKAWTDELDGGRTVD